MANITDLPLDILLIIVRHFSSAKDFLSLCSTSRDLQEDEDLKFAPSFWSRITKQTFRVPNQPVVASDGRRWRNLYRRLLRETKVYCWGNNDNGSLGKAQSREPYGMRGRRVGPRLAHRPQDGQASATWPQELPMPDDIGVIADLQCGGWSTAALNAEGKIHVTGMLRDALGLGGRSTHLIELLLPFGYDGEDRVRQFSLGRSHLLAVGDNGQVYNWDDIEQRGSPVTFPSLIEPTYVTKVVAGWTHSSCFMPGKGIVIWEPIPSRLQNSQDLPAEPTRVFNTWMVRYTAGIPSSKARQRPGGSQQITHTPPGPPDPDYGAVINWIMLSDFIVWVTDQGRAFAVGIPSNSSALMKFPFEITPNRGNDFEDSDILDVHGSHDKFALLKRNGEVLTSDQDYLLRAWAKENGPRDPAFEDQPSQLHQFAAYRKIPALQHTGVIQIAFGDWHFHALHANGTITSYGRESRFCGSLGLGGTGIDAVRGIKALGFGGDGELLPQCQTSGRRICFEPEKRRWIDHVRTGGSNKREAERRMNATYEDDDARAEISEWFECRLRHWEDVLPADANEGDLDNDGLPAHFALSVAAAGWHSGALILQNDKKAANVRKHYLKPQQNGSAEQVESDSAGQSTLEGLQSALITLGRSFLGLPPAGQSQTPSKPASATTDDGPWKWEDETFPRLRLKNGSTMAGKQAVEDWECPEWQEVEVIPMG